MAPSMPTRKHLTRDERLKILTLREEGVSYKRIADRLSCTYRQVQYICELGKATPRKGRGRKPKLSNEQLDDVISWIRSSFDNRQKSVYQIVAELELPVCGDTLRNMLKKRGMRAYPAAQAPPLYPRTPLRYQRW
ncbi:transposable element tc1 transposase [Penicillium macrosclerotiorum]|uniref:transposable element tc1 transposase n=1 Tax=Penicillium macrosclerotiorum TaxID=303699 RepID=UPI0025474C87|nr:transposable element tc1 transposase [Penicillium macrosclerotiorum]KAJ5675673.1 transposable element tc1 transposase [Penicillium macrosclerotiorum]